MAAEIALKYVYGGNVNYQRACVMQFAGIVVKLMYFSWYNVILNRIAPVLEDRLRNNEPIHGADELCASDDDEVGFARTWIRILAQR